MNIRCSGLPGVTDCARRSAAKTFKKHLEDDGYKFTVLPPSVGAVVGTSAHKGVEQAMIAKFYRKQATAADILGPAMEAFKKETETGCIFDDTTPNHNVAEQQIRTLVSAYINGPGKTVVPLRMPDGTPAIELALRANAGDGFTLTGTVDLAEDHGVEDFKTGSLSRNYSAQLGGYGLLAKSNGIIKDLQHLRIQFCKRVPKSKQQPQCQTQSYPVELSMQYALAIVNHVKRDWMDYKANQNIEMAFIANPCSLLCSPKYCPAYGTNFCQHGGVGK